MKAKLSLTSAGTICIYGDIGLYDAARAIGFDIDDRGFTASIFLQEDGSVILKKKSGPYRAIFSRNKRETSEFPFFGRMKVFQAHVNGKTVSQMGFTYSVQLPDIIIKNNNEIHLRRKPDWKVVEFEDTRSADSETWDADDIIEDTPVSAPPRPKFEPVPEGEMTETQKIKQLANRKYRDKKKAARDEIKAERDKLKADRAEIKAEPGEIKAGRNGVEPVRADRAGLIVQEGNFTIRRENEDPGNSIAIIPKPKKKKRKKQWSIILQNSKSGDVIVGKLPDFIGTMVADIVKPYE